MESLLGDTEYYASTDYNQRLEQKAEAMYEEKTAVVEEKIDVKSSHSSDIEEAIANYNLNVLYSMASKALTNDDYMKLLTLNDKDIHIQLARNTNISDQIAEKLIGTVYLAHKNLLENPAVGQEVKNKLIEKLKEMPSIYRDILCQFFI